MASYYTSHKIQTSYYGWFTRPDMAWSLPISYHSSSHSLCSSPHWPSFCFLKSSSLPPPGFWSTSFSFPLAPHLWHQWSNYALSRGRQTNFMGILMEMTHYMTTYECSCQNCLKLNLPRRNNQTIQKAGYSTRSFFYTHQKSKLHEIVSYHIIYHPEKLGDKTFKTGISNICYAITSS